METNQSEKMSVADSEFLRELARKVDVILKHIDGKPVESGQAWLSIGEAAKRSGLSHKHIRRAIDDGELPCSNVSRGSSRPTYRLAVKDLDNWFLSRRVETTPNKVARSELVNEIFGNKKEKKGPKTLQGGIVSP